MYSATKSVIYFNGNAEETMYNMRDPFKSCPMPYIWGSDEREYETTSRSPPTTT